MTSLWSRTRQALEMVKFSHSIFALPFALSSLLLAANGKPQPWRVILIILCMVTARNVAMAFNRLVDADMDAKNPRTKDRHIPLGILTPRFALVFITINALLFVGFAAAINTLTLILAIPTLAVLCSYSYAKRFTDFTQIYLGVCLGLSPIGAWIAIQGKIAPIPILMAAGVTLWVAGFDLIYAMQDHEFDSKNSVKSLVVKLGITNALFLSRLFHVVCIVFLCAVGWIGSLGIPYWISQALISLLLIYEQNLLRPSDLSRINSAFFNMNGVIGIVYLLGTAAAIYI